METITMGFYGTNQKTMCLFFGLILLLFIFFSIFFTPQRLCAGIATDGSVGPAESLTGPDYLIPDDLGATVGQNLFHSFKQFSVHQGESVTFTGPDTLKNVISRVTGGEQSVINGLLRSEVGQADFFFINPSGVIFGPEAAVDVQGSFHMSSSDYLSMDDNGRFDALQPGRSVLTSAPPAAFGFLNENPGEILFEGSDITVSAGKDISVVGGNIIIGDSPPGNGFGVGPISGPGGASLVAPGGKISLVSTASPGELSIDTMGISGFPYLGHIIISSAPEVWWSRTSSLSTGHEPGGAIFIRANQFIVDNGSLGGSKGRYIDIGVRESFTLMNGRMNINSSPGQGGDILISAGDSVIIDNSIISSSTLSEAGGGKISIETEKLVLKNRAGIYHDVGQSSMFNPVAGRGGDILISAGDSVTIEDYSFITTSTFSEGDGGSISIQTDRLSLKDGGNIYAGVFPSHGSDPFHFFIPATGKGGNIQISAADSVSIESGGYIHSSTLSKGDGGAISIETGRLAISKGAIMAEGSGGGQGVGGGQGGVIEIKSGTIEIDDEGVISAHTWGSGDAGAISLEADQVAVTDGGLIVGGVGEYGTGDGGDIEIKAGRVIITGGAVTASAYGASRGGTISIEADKLFVTDSGGIMAAVGPLAAGDGGDVNLHCNIIYLRDGMITTSVEGTSGDGGNITLHGTQPGVATGFLIMDNGFIQANAPAGARGGDVFIDAEWLIASGGAVDVGCIERIVFIPGSGRNIIQAAAPGGEHGDIQVTAPDLDLSDSLVILNVQLITPLQLATDPCRVTGRPEASTLVPTSRHWYPAGRVDHMTIYFSDDPLENVILDDITPD